MKPVTGFNDICHRFPAIRHTKPSRQLQCLNKRWRYEERELEKKRGEKRERGSVDKWGKRYCSVLWADEKDKVQDSLLQPYYKKQPCKTCIRLGRKIMRNTLELQISKSRTVNLQIHRLSERISAASVSFNTEKRPKSQHLQNSDPLPP